MRTMKFLFCAACLCSAGVFARTAMTQEELGRPIKPPLSATINDQQQPLKATEPPTSDSRPDSDLLLVRPADTQRSLFRDPAPGYFEESGQREYRTRTTAAGLPVEAGNVPGPPGTPAKFMRPRQVTRTVIETHLEPYPQEELEALKKLHAAIQSLRTDKDEAARKAAADVIQQQLTTQFESDLRQREKDLSEVELRVKTLREQLNNRKAAQAEIINLRLQTLVNDANGLGFPDASLGIRQTPVVLPDESPLYDPGPERTRRPTSGADDNSFSDQQPADGSSGGELIPETRRFVPNNE